jgi:hypothetical protein
VARCAQRGGDDNRKAACHKEHVRRRNSPVLEFGYFEKKLGFLGGTLCRTQIIEVPSACFYPCCWNDSPTKFATKAHFSMNWKMWRPRMAAATILFFTSPGYFRVGNLIEDFKVWRRQHHGSVKAKPKS